MSWKYFKVFVLLFITAFVFIFTVVKNHGQSLSEDATQEIHNSDRIGPFSVYAAGGMFNLHELATNVSIKEAVWRLSNGKFRLNLPQSIELREWTAAHIRNVALLAVVKADVVMVRFDGLELDSGTVVEFDKAKTLGKPVVILRSDGRGLPKEANIAAAKALEEPYNLMVKNWPRTVEVHFESLSRYALLLAEQRKTDSENMTFQTTIQPELGAIQKCIDEIAAEIVKALEKVIEMKSPYPAGYKEIVYKAFRHSPGSGFDKFLTEKELDQIIQRLRKNGTL